MAQATNSNNLFMTVIKGFAMGCADIVPGVSGGTVAFITGIYSTLLESISSFDHHFLKLVLKGRIREALLRINAAFIFPLLFGIFSAIAMMSRVMHFLMNDYPIFTWSAFFGLIGASIIFVGKQIENLGAPKNLLSLAIGTLIGYLVVSLIPVHLPNTHLIIFLSGMVAITAMILPGISGSFILLILGQYTFITGALKSFTSEGNYLYILAFLAGCVLGIISFSKFLNWFMHTHKNLATTVLTGFMLGSLKKIWPWKKVIESIEIRGKTHVLQEANILPAFTNEFYIALLIMILGFSIVFMIEILSKLKTRGVSSAG